MTIPDTCTDSLPTIRYAQSSGVAGRMCECNSVETYFQSLLYCSLDHAIEVRSSGSEGQRYHIVGFCSRIGTLGRLTIPLP